MMSASTTASTDSSSPRVSLLSSLQCDFQQENKRSVRACLRSKHLPCPQVSKLLESQSISFENIAQAQEIVLRDYLPVLSSLPEENRNSLWYMSHIGTIHRFLQLLLEYNNRKPLQDHSNHISLIPQAQIDKWAGSIISKLAQNLVQMLRQNSNNDDNNIIPENDEDDILTADASTSFDARSVVCYSIGSMLRMNRYARCNMTICLALFKGISEVFKASASFVPLALSDQALQILSVYLQDGINQMMEYCKEFVTQKAQISLKQQGGQARLLQFFVTRAIGVSQSIRNKHVGQSNELSNMLRLLLTLMGSVDTTHALLVENDAYVDENHEFFKMYTKIVTQVGAFLEHLVLRQEECGGGEENKFIDLSALDKLLEIITISSAMEVSDPMPRTSLILGLVSIGNKILNALVEQQGMVEQNSSSTLVLLEGMLRSIIPQCQSTFNLVCFCASASSVPSKWKTTLLSSSVQGMAQVLVRIEANLEPAKRVQLHSLFLRWLSPISDHNELHSISKELVLSLLETHVLLLHRQGAQAASGPFLSLLIKVLFDPRTATPLRECISSLILRLSAKMPLQEQLQQLVAEEFLRHHKMHTSNRKRKRSSNSNVPLIAKVLSVDDFQSISNVMMKLCTSDLLEGPLRWFGTQLVGDSSKRRIGAASLEWSSFLLSCLCGVLLSGSPDVRDELCQSLVKLPLKKLVERVVTWPRELCNLQHLKETRTLTKKQSMLTLSVLQFYRQLTDNGFVGSIPEVSSLISFCSSAPFLIVSNGSLTRVNGDPLIHKVVWEIISLLGTIGRAIPGNCPKPELKVTISFMGTT
jgi:hypothetical protein